MRKRIQRLLLKAFQALKPKPPQDLVDQNRFLSDRLRELQDVDRQRRNAYMEMVEEMAEALRMAGAGPWRVSGKVITETNKLIASARQTMGMPLRESNPLVSQGAYGDIELALQNVEWRREVNLSWLEFSRWGIQQIILIARLYYIKNPIIRRLVDISAAYVFGRGVEVSSPDEAANEQLKRFFEANASVLGQNALAQHHRAKLYDGNLFFALFPDETDTGEVKVRMLDATEVQDIVTDPEDSQVHWYYRRSWTVRKFDPANGTTSTSTTEAWYPALGYDPEDKPDVINGLPVMWNCRVYHRKSGAISQWHFGCPKIYPALDWAKAARKYLEACLTVRQSLAQFAATITTKGGQQAIEGIKQQLQTSVGPSAPLWDINPPAVSGATIVSGPGTTLQAFNTRGAGGDPEDVRRYLLMCCMVAGVPETFLADVSTGNLATATTLDRPTELVFLEEQEAWREDLVLIAKYVLQVSNGAPAGKIRAAMDRKGYLAGEVEIREAPTRKLQNGRTIYVEAKRKPNPKVLEVKATFPTIREGDQQGLMTALVQAATLGNTQGQFAGIDERAFALRAYEILGIEDGAELVEQQYPEKTYEPDRTLEPEPPAEPQTPQKPEDMVKAATELRKAAESLRGRRAANVR